ncbi:hypothetical protein, partial [Geobacillus thermoleovorans]
MRNIRLRRWLVWMVVWALMMSSIPTKGFAETIQSGVGRVAPKEEPPKVPEAPKRDLKPGEIIEERTENTKVYYNGDGTFTKKIYFEPIHIKKKNQKRFEEVSSSLTDSTNNTNYVETQNTILETNFYKKMVDGEYANFHYNGYSISYSILEAAGNDVQPIKAKDVAAVYKKKDNKILHKNIFPSIDLQNITFNEST